MRLKERILCNKQFKKADTFLAWRNPFGIWFVTLFDKDEEAFFEIQYSMDVKSDCRYMDRKLHELNTRKENN